jgi:nitrate reductase gamma subunit
LITLIAGVVQLVTRVAVVVHRRSANAGDIFMISIAAIVIIAGAHTMRTPPPDL